MSGANSPSRGLLCFLGIRISSGYVRMADNLLSGYRTRPDSIRTAEIEGCDGRLRPIVVGGCT